jgi:hypothetical protein
MTTTIQSIQATVVTLSNDYISVLNSQVYDLPVDNTAEIKAKAFAASIDAAGTYGVKTHTSIQNYIVTLPGTGFGYVTTYTVKNFESQILPTLPAPSP